MLKIINNPYHQVPIEMPHSKSFKFYPGNIALMDNGIVESVNPMIFGLPSQGIVYGIFDDSYEPPINSCTNGLATIWELLDFLTIETDEYDLSRQYKIGEALYYNFHGEFTNFHHNSIVDQIGTVGTLPNLTNPCMTIDLCTPNTAATTQNTTLSNGNITGATGATGAIATLTGSGFMFTHTVPVNTQTNCLGDIKNIIIQEPIFGGIDFPNGLKGSICKSCGNCNEYILERNYICYNCKG